MSPELRALEAHCEEHGCGCPGSTEQQRHFCSDWEGHQEGHKLGGFIHCPAAMVLWDALPDHERIAVG